MTTSALFIVLALLMAGQGFAWVIQPSYDESAVPDDELPGPLVMADGTPVSTTEQWPARRAELVEQFTEQMFGRLELSTPGEAVVSEWLESDGRALDGRATRRQVRVCFTEDPDGPAMELLVYLPNGTDGPVPVFFGMNFDGNHTVHADPAIRITQAWVRNRAEVGAVDHRASEEGRGVMASRWPVEALIARGYGLATAYYGDLDPDFDDGFRNGLHALLDGAGDTQRPGDAGGAIAAWAWGYRLAMDYFESDPAVDAQRVIAIGHSRLGKTALWAGATDERFAMVVSNNSGCGGAALSRRRFGETIYAINTRFPHWFCASFHTYNDNESALPFDQHALLALMAPRPVYIASAADDRWADPRGEYLAGVHASPVYALLGDPGLVGAGDHLPAVGTPLQDGRIGYHVRTGGHDLTRYDWDRYMDFADRHLGGSDE